MSVLAPPDIAGDMLRVHAVITRALEVSMQHCDGFANQSAAASSTREGFFTYIEALATVLHGHHLTEDELAFPYLRERMPELPYDRLTAEHQQIVVALREIAQVIGSARTGDTERTMQDLAQVLARVAAIWHPHIEQEERCVTRERLDEIASPDEHARLSDQIADFSRAHSVPDYLVVPFLLYNLPAGERAIMAQKFPPIVTEQLVPVAWAGKWTPMKPFLLD
jgi:hemerythrin-like domain-containing protein